MNTYWKCAPPPPAAKPPTTPNPPTLGDWLKLTGQSLERTVQLPGDPGQPPVQIPEGLLTSACGRFLLNTYSNALKYMKLASPYRTLPKDARKSKHWATLTAAIPALYDHEIPVAPWCLFCIESYNWRKVPVPQKEWKTPPVTYIFDPKRIHDRRGWFRSESGRFCPRRTMYTPEYKSLVQRFGEMTIQLAAAETEEQAADIVSRHFPDGEYDKLSRQVTLQSSLAEADLKVSAALGEWLW